MMLSVELCILSSCFLTPMGKNSVQTRMWADAQRAPGKIPSGGQEPRKCIYDVPVQETAKESSPYSGDMWRR